MFTGIVEEIGTIAEISRTGASMRIAVKGRVVLEGTRAGDSISVNGICVTVASLNRTSFSAELSPETLEKTNMETARSGDNVNLERAVSATSRFGGHFVTGHIDGTGIFDSISHEQGFWKFKVKASEHLMRYIASRGSVAINGVSLTPYECTKEDFSVMIIPHTLDATSLKSAHSGDIVNIECDILAKYVEQLLLMRSVPSSIEGSAKKIDADFLRRTGFLI